LGMRCRGLSPNLTWLSIGLCSALMSRPVRAQTDEIQVYTGGLEAPGKFNLTVHANFRPNAQTIPRFPGGIVPQGSTNGALEWAYGVSDWFEAGAYVPVYTVTRNGKLLLDGVKLRALFTAPRADSRRVFYGV
jgi:hypothetical protein